MRIMLFLLTLCLIGLILFYSSCTKDVARVPLKVCDSLNVKYSTDIYPIVLANCAISGCHDGNAPGNFNTYAGLKSKVDDGKLKSRVLTLKDMPPSGPLPDSSLQKIECWLNDGAPNN